MDGITTGSSDSSSSSSSGSYEDDQVAECTNVHFSSHGYGSGTWYWVKWKLVRYLTRLIFFRYKRESYIIIHFAGKMKNSV